MKVTCPHCNNVLNFDSTKGYIGGCGASCGTCKGTFTLPLYCQHAPPSKDPPTFKFNLKFLGGERLTCSCGRVFVPPVTETEVNGRLGDMGTELSRYHQNVRIAAIKKDNLKAAVGKGYCAGAALDWIRRAVLGGKLNYENVESSLKKEQFSSQDEMNRVNKQLRQDERGATAWCASNAGKRTKFTQTRGNELTQNAQQTCDEVNEWRRKLRDNVAEGRRRLRDKGFTGNEIETRLAPLVKSLNDSLNEATTKFTNAQNERDRFYAQSSMERFWGEFCKSMDRVIIQQRHDLGKSGPSRRSFDRLRLAADSNDQSYNGVAVFIDTVLAHNQFLPGRAAYIGLNPPDGSMGHAIAIHRQPYGNKYNLFDPNFGVYSLDRDKVREAVIYLFRQAYPNMGGGGDGHAYEVNGKVSGCFSIFEGTQPVIQTVERRPVIETNTAKKPLGSRPVINTEPNPIGTKVVLKPGTNVIKPTTTTTPKTNTTTRNNGPKPNTTEQNQPSTTVNKPGVTIGNQRRGNLINERMKNFQN